MLNPDRKAGICHVKIKLSRLLIVSLEQDLSWDKDLNYYNELEL
jgi:hypothetical protein